MAARKTSPVAKIVELKRLIKGAAILVDGGSEIYDSESPVHVALVFNVQSYGPHTATIYAENDRYHSSADGALQAAYELLEEHEIEHDPEYVSELQEEYGDDWNEVLTETFDGRWFTMSFRDFARAIRGTKAEKYIDLDVD